MNFDMERVEESKRAMRERLAALPIAEKLRMLEVLREREITLRKSPAPRMDRVNSRDDSAAIESSSEE